MEERKVFCPECREEVSFTVKNKKIQTTLHGEKYTYTGRVAYCNNCSSEIYVDDVNDFNLKALYDEFRVKHDIISLKTILNISKKYDIGETKLSLVLGWGEQTFSNYCKGDIPTKQHSDILKKIYNEPKYFRDILENKKDNLYPFKDYKESKKAVNEILKG